MPYPWGWSLYSPSNVCGDGGHCSNRRGAQPDVTHNVHCDRDITRQFPFPNSAIFFMRWGNQNDTKYSKCIHTIDFYNGIMLASPDTRWFPCPWRHTSFLVWIDANLIVGDRGTTDCITWLFAWFLHLAVKILISHKSKEWTLIVPFYYLWVLHVSRQQ